MNEQKRRTANESYRPASSRQDSITIGTGVFIGAIIGALIGNALGGSAGTLAGAILGAIIGALIGKAVRRPRAEARTNQLFKDTQVVESRAALPSRSDVDASLTRRSETAATSTASTQAAWNRVDRSDVVKVPLVEERLEIDKRELDAGLVRLRKVVKTEVVNVPVEVRREEIVVERIAAGENVPADTASSITDYQHGDEIVIPLVKEEVVVQKEAKVFSEVHVHKVSRTETTTVHEQVRHTDVVEGRGDQR